MIGVLNRDVKEKSLPELEFDHLTQMHLASSFLTHILHLSDQSRDLLSAYDTDLDAVADNPVRL